MLYFASMLVEQIWRTKTSIEATRCQNGLSSHHMLFWKPNYSETLSPLASHSGRLGRKDIIKLYFSVLSDDLMQVGQTAGSRFGLSIKVSPNLHKISWQDTSQKHHMTYWGKIYSCKRRCEFNWGNTILLVTSSVTLWYILAKNWFKCFVLKGINC